MVASCRKLILASKLIDPAHQWQYLYHSDADISDAIVRNYVSESVLELSQYSLQLVWGEPQYSPVQGGAGIKPVGLN